MRLGELDLQGSSLRLATDGCGDHVLHQWRYGEASATSREAIGACEVLDPGTDEAKTCKQLNIKEGNLLVSS